MSTTVRDEPYTGPDTSAQLIALQHLEHIAGLQSEPAERTGTSGRRAGTVAAPAPPAPPTAPAPQAAPWSDVEAYVPEQAPVLAPERAPARHGRADPERLAERWRRLPLLGRVPLVLVVVLAVQAGLSLRLVWSNSAFADESLYLWAGHLEWARWLDGTSIATQSLPTFFSGAPVIYPPLGALADSIGGLAGARLLSLVFMLGATSFLYAAARQLFGARSAGFAVALFAGASATQFLGAFATYDAMALFLLALAAWAGVRAAACRTVTTMVVLGASAGAAMALADAAKYAAALFDPVVVGVTAMALWRACGWRRAVAGTGAVLGAAVVLAGAGLWEGGHQFWKGITTTTLTRAVGGQSASTVLFISGKWIAAVAFLAVCGAIVAAWQRDWPTGLLGVLLAFTVFLAPVEQARIHTITSLFKHVGYGMWFASMVAGFALASLVGAVPDVKRAAAGRVGAVTVALAAVPGVAFASSHFAGWPDSTQMIAQIAPILEQTPCPCLATQNNAIDYYLHETSHSELQNTFSFHYRDWRTHRDLSGAAAASAAIGARYFNVVEIDPSQNPGAYGPIVAALKATHGYQLVGISSSGNPREPTEIWVLDGAAG